MSDVLIRDVSPADLDLIRAAAADRGVSVQSYLLDTVQAQAAWLRRQEALDKAAQRLAGQAQVPDRERAAVLSEVDTEHSRRGRRLGARRRA